MAKTEVDDFNGGNNVSDDQMNVSEVENDDH